MISFELLQLNLLSPMVLAFFLGVMAVWAKSDLQLPEGLYASLSMYLLLALGLKGGAYLSQTSFNIIGVPAAMTLLLGMVLPVIAYVIAHFIGRFSQADSAALAAHYGSVSVVTFMACEVFVETLGTPGEGFMAALVAILEIPGIIIALLLAEHRPGVKQESSLWQRLEGILFSKSILLLLGGLLIGFISGKPGLEKISPFFIAPFQGVLVLFMLDMGLVAGERLNDLKQVKGFLFVYAFLIPILNGALGVYGGYLAGLSLGGATILGAMSASASYIAAPAAVRVSIPDANPVYYLTSAIALTFPFNLAFGIPLYYQFAVWLFGR
ncbi:sodium-dependent bicarbonate transport family permease [Candidatus Finniella inopinata]|uniref:Sodium-dependent bicarbonate transport family permease n=1 Tax=Candidatus Finniella inopinata TaxID=1696036 RepID=A0A4Q7DIQ4_9PROT|nr:sodium-dependent bicarbonate transport family permease [Candidatus Finniella inopinata]RZI46612.1 sodium-dependent bicarbonate transport family permease [Candidatus Finniella inopinata]